ncbi:hypothetical protein F5141DRAFT_1221472 [Pisolithus sp. B1]|nr:hypothetical protein F5141DRAFT_1221472 [Pisolithus sp. B1]
MPVTTDGKPLPVYDEDQDPLRKCKLKIEHIIPKDGLEVYKDQADCHWTGLVTYWIKWVNSIKQKLHSRLVLNITTGQHSGLLPPPPLPHMHQ